MGKYMKKPKPKSELPLLDSTTTVTTATATTTTYYGVRTRAKTLALSLSQNQDLSVSNDSYLQLRSRRLQKPPTPQHSSKKSKPQNQNPKSPIPTKEKTPEAEDAADFGENVLDFEGRERSTRETTPVNLIRNPDVLRTPSSTTKRTFSTDAHRRAERATRTVIPSTREMDEFFAKNEAEQQKKFMEKYNFDPVTEMPLPGRYEWEKITP
ncbi:cyclin-dependent kinase inhibitor 4-like isoform X2 [Vicia villosa]|uniref:cyclin-dependent kinase inhibitor 4-like isoform X2 n=1 Tax=Vicia villosa TaxID=3911 RepID=UPI00273B8CA1|nr:cyclin-dependent kinase inhibitor 4-like isoform X2 [Vicia villosa]